jgi:hypothetical protein
MSLTRCDPPHDFPDPAIREQLQNPGNLRELLHEFSAFGF